MIHKQKNPGTRRMPQPKSSARSLDAEIAAYSRMKPDLEKHYLGKWVLIRDGKLIGQYDEFDTAAREAVSKFGRGPYLIRQVGAPPIRLPASVMFRSSNPAE